MIETWSLSWEPRSCVAGGLGQNDSPVTLPSSHRSYFIVMVPLRKSRGGQFLTPLGSPEDMDLEEVRDRAGPAGPRSAPAELWPPALCSRSSSRTSRASRGGACDTHGSWRCPGPTSPPASQLCPSFSVLGTRSNMVASTTGAWSLATDMSSLCLLCCRRMSP